MLIEITRMCNEKCTHCMISATPDGPHMKFDTFTKAVSFALVNKIRVISISGGEPTLHPEFFKMVRYLLNSIKGKEVIVILESNGWWIEDKKLCDRIAKLMNDPQIVGMQISTNKNFYPNYEFTMSHQKDFESLHPKIKFTHDWQGVDTKLRYMGRGKNIMKKSDAKGMPNCMNFVSYALNLNNLGIPKLKHNIKTLTEIGIARAKTCTPYINISGEVSICEGDCVPALISIKNVTSRQHIEKLSQEMFRKILDFIPCNKCGSFVNMSQDMCQKMDDFREQFGLPRKFEDAWLGIKNSQSSSIE